MKKVALLALLLAPIIASAQRPNLAPKLFPDKYTDRWYKVSYYEGINPLRPEYKLVDSTFQLKDSTKAVEYYYKLREHRPVETVKIVYYEGKENADGLYQLRSRLIQLPLKKP